MTNKIWQNPEPKSLLKLMHKTGAKTVSVCLHVCECACVCRACVADNNVDLITFY